MVKRMPIGLRTTALVIGLLAALAPAALLAYDAGSSRGEGARIVAQATATATARPATATATGTARPATATGTAAPAAPRTGNAGLASGQTGAAAIALLGVITLAGVAGGRLMTSRRS